MASTGHRRCLLLLAALLPLASASAWAHGDGDIPSHRDLLDEQFPVTEGALKFADIEIHYKLLDISKNGERERDARASLSSRVRPLAPPGAHRRHGVGLYTITHAHMHRARGS